MSLQFINSENNEFIEDLAIKGKYCKEELNKIIKYDKKIIIRRRVIENLKKVVIIVQIFLMVIIILIFLLFQLI